MTALFDLLVETARNLEALFEADATGGSATTIIDTKLGTAAGGLSYPDDHWNGGTALIVKDAGGAGAAPEKQSRVVSDFVAASGTITVAAFTAGVAAGDIYGVMTKRFPRGQMVGKVNSALAEVGPVPTVDTSLLTAADTLEYNLPVAAKRDLRQVWLATGTAAPYDWEPLMTVYVEPAGAGSSGKLIFPYQPRVGYTIKLVYIAPHGYVFADADAISDYVSIPWLSLQAAIKTVRWRLEGPGKDERDLTALLNDLMVRFENERPLLAQDWPTAFPMLPYLPDAEEPIW